MAVIDGKPYTWNSAYVEILNHTLLGEKIYTKLIAMDII